MKGVPLAYMESCNGKLIGDILGRFLETDLGEKCSLGESAINQGDFKPFGPWLRAEVKEWLDGPEMEPRRSLRPRWVMKAPSTDELGLAG
ncbi:Hypothetical predicted protein [Prunus dulcis]|uniref:Uncharacterized protein n=1 Tax=Prunus dulcis TaxID=3755 RepID=A0A5E4F1Y0_PRUDU|nr:hypothetical protein L3X38_033948 [Prunus dulcis]VVA21069.1 Hypothetical predicted protein [Prunus dulcis]